MAVNIVNSTVAVMMATSRLPVVIILEPKIYFNETRVYCDSSVFAVQQQEQ